MKTLQITKRAFIAVCALLTLGLATLQPASAGVTVTDTPVERPLVGDGQETHGGKG